MPPPRVLISGASIAGPALAFWLVRAGCTVTVVEQARSLRSEGQGVDIRGAAREVVRRMGLFDAIRARSSHEAGIAFVDGASRPFARFGVDLASGNGASMTCDIEILRGDLARILYECTAGPVRYVFGEVVEGMAETGEGDVEVHFKRGAPSERFDLVVAADGIGSKIRSMAALGSGSGAAAEVVVSKNAFIAYFSLPKVEGDGMWARVHWVAGGRCLVMRPDKEGLMRAFLMMTFYDPADERLARLHRASKQGWPEQKALVQELFQDADWEGPRMLAAMHDADDFYFQHVAQIKLDRWSSGRVAVVGDAGYAPTPFSGMGTSLAFIGAYVLAGEISKRLDDIPAALKSYEQITRPYIERVQKLPPGVPWLFNPQTAIGVRVLQSAMWCISTISDSFLAKSITKIASLIPWTSKQDFVLPEYEAFKK
ncbi:hypothetical protein LZ554_005897 [Drepanopeziza brunnea f. sp. 'monogermtubi']|nr:hypothetical protein LZ554_005897 [Drepanopeziza brunnea f. sp. 'monogermtubi']